MYASYLKELEEVENFIEEIGKSVSRIKNEMERSDLEAQVFLVKLKHERVRAMAAVEKSRSILAKMELIMAKAEIAMSMNQLEINSSKRSRKRKSNDQNEASKSKKIRPTSDQEPIKEKSTKRSSKTSKENQKKEMSPKKSHSKNPQDELTTVHESLRCSTPLQNVTNSDWPVSGKKTIFLENPPVRDTKINKNVGYYSTAYAHEIIGYNPDTVPKTETQKENQRVCEKVTPRHEHGQIDLGQLNPAYNLSVTPGYNLNVMPGYLVQHKAQVHQTEDSYNKRYSTKNDQFKRRIDVTKQLDTPNISSGGDNCKTTNQLFRELMCNKRNEAKDDEIRSLASIETLVLTMNLDDFKNLTPEF